MYEFVGEGLPQLKALLSIVDLVPICGINQILDTDGLFLGGVSFILERLVLSFDNTHFVLESYGLKVIYILLSIGCKKVVRFFS
jgi:hypothetical protein